jgi:undecaprenyl diphosphate synthase
MNLLLWVAQKEIDELHKNGIRVIFLGKEVPLPEKMLKAIRAAEAKTASNSRGTLGLCLNYGGQTEIAEAVQKIINQGIRAADVTPDTIQQHLYAPEIPDLDLIIRTSGEERLSNFMLWRAAYAELYFEKSKHWPDFNEADLDKALAEYGERVRRFGQ